MDVDGGDNDIIMKDSHSSPATTTTTAQCDADGDVVMVELPPFAVVAVNVVVITCLC